METSTKLILKEIDEFIIIFLKIRLAKILWVCSFSKTHLIFCISLERLCSGNPGIFDAKKNDKMSIKKTLVNLHDS